MTDTPGDAIHFGAPWGRALKLLSAFSTVVCIGAGIAALLAVPRPLNLIGFLPLTIPPCTFPFMIRGYTVTREALLVHRPFWTNSIPLRGLESARFEPSAMRRSLRTFGNGGLFSITGYYYSRRLGAYRTFVTDLNRTVVLKFSNRTVVVSPDAPEQFAHALTPTENPSR